MSDWTAGYVADIDYTYGYYPELNPLRTKLLFLHAGLAVPEISTACELGFGQGLSINIHAAGSTTHWCGTDFNPSQAGFAQNLEKIAGSGARLFGDAFADFAQRNDLPDFDYIGLHGIWSWISDKNRSVLVDFIHRKLRVGGVLYISYNTQPGWGAMVPLRDLLTEHGDVMGSSGQGIVGRIDGALAFAEKLFAVNPIYARANPLVQERFNKLKEQNRNYLAHEYFNRDWLPMPFSQMTKWLAPAKLQFACSAHYLDHIDALNLTDEQYALLTEIPDIVFRETVRDFIVNQQFRKDYWVKGAQKSSPFERMESIRRQKIMLVSHRPDVTLKAQGLLGESTMHTSIYNPLLDMLADHQPKTLGELEQMLRGKISHSQLVQAVIVLSGGAHVVMVQDDDAIALAKPRTNRLNMHLLAKAQGTKDISFLASPITGGGFAVGRFQQLFLLARSHGQQQPEKWARFVWDILLAQSQRLLIEGKPLTTEEENLAELNRQAQEFAEKRLPILKALGIAE